MFGDASRRQRATRYRTSLRTRRHGLAARRECSPSQPRKSGPAELAGRIAAMLGSEAVEAELTAAPAPKWQMWAKFGVALAISVLFAGLFLRGLDLDQVWQSLRHANYLYVAPALALFGVSVCVRAERWRYFLLPANDLSWRQLLPSVLIGYAGNNLLP